MAEILENSKQLKENLNLELQRLGNDNPKIVSFFVKTLESPSSEEKPIILEGKVADYYTEYTPTANTFYREGASSTDRVANLLFWANKFLKPAEVKGIKSKFKNFLNKEKMNEDRVLSEKIDHWIQGKYSKSRKFK